MDLREFYSIVGADYDEVIGRLTLEKLAIRFLHRFEEDQCYVQLLESLEKKDYKEAFRFAHSIKGMCLNIGLGHLKDSSSILCEALRNGEPTEDITPMLDTVKKDYTEVMEAIGHLD